jgi:tetratricopeptide (TPR) repeat protein/O-antigen ligase
MVAEGRLEWRRSAIDLPLALLIVAIGLQLVLGNRPFALWALAPAPNLLDAPARLPAAFLTLGTVAPAHTARSLLVLLTYASAYLLVVNVIRTREQLGRLVGTLVAFGGLLAFLSLLDYLTGNAWLLTWRDRPLGGRLAGTFSNPDHFAAWLAMVICLGLGWLAGRRPSDEGLLGPRLSSREGREQAARQYLPFIGLVVMALALVFTLSRGGALSLLLTFVILLALLGRLGRIRWSLAVVGTLVVVALGYAVWIGLEPFLARVKHGDYMGRWVLALTTLPMVRSFPFFGVGLGAYADIYGHYQPAVFEPGKIEVRHAHNDPLQLIVELGILGTVPVLLMVWRVGKDLLGAHLLGRASCPVAGGEDEGARRRDPFNVGIAVGAIGAVLVLLVHSNFDFVAHIPANGVLAAACLGIATVALHTRFGVGGARLLTAVYARSLSTRTARVAVAAIVIVPSLALVPWILRPPLVWDLLQAATRRGADRPTALGWAEAALAVDPQNERGRAVRGRLRLEAALETWNLGVTLDGRVLLSWGERRATSLPLVRGAVEDFRTALAGTPVDPYLHESLARAHWTLALVDAEHASNHLSDALASFSRAVESAPQSPFAYRSLAVFAVAQGGRFTELGLRAARNAVARDPALLVQLVDQFVPLGLSASQWIAAVPDSALGRLELGSLLEKRVMVSEAAHAYRQAVEIAPARDTALPRWMLARLLVRQARGREALAELDQALTQDAANPELHLERARALAILGDASAVDAYRLALLNAEVRARKGGDDAQLFGPLPPRARALVADATGEPRIAPGRYRRALAQYLTDRKLWDQALKQWEMVLGETPTDAAAHFARGVALDGVRARDQAVEAYRRAVALDGNSVAFRLRLAQRLWETEQYYQAMNEWQTVLGQAPGNLEARLALARAYVKSGQRNDAVLEYQRLLQIAPDQPEVRRELAGLGAPDPGAKARARD